VSFKIIPYNEIDKGKWNQFVDTHPQAWWWHRTEWIDYVDSRDDHLNLSFALQDNWEYTRIDPLFLNDKKLQVEGEPGPMPLVMYALTDFNVIIAQDKLVTEYFSGMKEEHQWTDVRYRMAIPVPEYMPSPWPGEVRNASWKTRVIMIPPDWSGVRKSYRPLITKVKRDKKIQVIGSGDEAFDGLEAFHSLHRKANKGETRPVGTWGANYDWLQSGNALLVLVGEPAVAGAYFIKYKNMAYYASGASIEPNCQHGAIWIGLEALAKEGMEQVEIGWMARPWDNEKYKNIAFFKSGFGGVEQWISSYIF